MGRTYAKNELLFFEKKFSMRLFITLFKDYAMVYGYLPEDDYGYEGVEQQRPVSDNSATLA